MNPSSSAHDSVNREYPSGDGPAGRSELHSFLDDLAALLSGSSPAGDLRKELAQRVALARGQIHTAVEHGRDLSHRARESIDHGIDASRSAIAQRPFTSLAAATGVGLIIGLLISRR